MCAGFDVTGTDGTLEPMVGNAISAFDKILLQGMAGMVCGIFWLEIVVIGLSWITGVNISCYVRLLYRNHQHERHIVQIVVPR